MKVAIVGCGDIGLRTSRLLVDRGHSVLGVRRDSSRLPDWIERISADVNQPDNLGFLSQSNLDVVIYCLAAAGFNEAAYRSAYVTGVSNTLNALGARASGARASGASASGANTAASLRRFIFVSSTSVYHQNDGSIVDEESATNPVRFNGQLVLEGERQVRALQTGTVVRFSGIYGSGRTRMIDRVREGIRAEADDNGYTNRIHVDDCAGVLAHLVSLVDAESAANGNSETGGAESGIAESGRAESGRAVESLYLASDSTPCTRVELETFLARELGIAPGDSDYGNGLRQADATTPAAPKTAKRIAGSKRCSNARLLGTGYRFRYPDYRSGYRQVLADSGS